VVFLGWIWWIISNTVFLILWVFGALLFGLWWNQGKLLYMSDFENKGKRSLDNNPPGYKTPSEVGLPYEDHMLQTTDGEHIHCWLLTQPAISNAPTVIFFHGNAGNIGFRLPLARNIYHNARANVLMVDYKGYGNSTGRPSEKGCLIDAQVCLDFLLKRDDIDKKKIFLFGRSLGGGVAVGCGWRNKDKICGMILENTFLSIDKMVTVLLQRMVQRDGGRLVDIFLYFYLTSHFKSEKTIKCLTCPVLFISGLADELIPPEHMKTLYEKCSSKKTTFLEIHDGTHNDTHLVDPVSYHNTFSNFIFDHCQ